MTRVLVRKLADTAVAPLGNLVKADAHHAIVDARHVLAEAEAQARRALAAATARGREIGEAEGRIAAATLMARTVADVDAYLRGAEARLAAIVTDAVRRIVGAFDDEELVLRVVGQLLGDAAVEGRIRLRVSPGDVRTVRERLDAMRTELPDVESVEVAADADVDAGGCRMETDVGFVATSVDEQLEVLRAALAGRDGA